MDSRRSHRTYWRRYAGLFAVAAAMLLPGAVARAQTGVIAGTVTEGSTGRGLSAVRLQVVGSQNLVTSTDDRGHYTLRNVPPGGVSLRATRIGYRPMAQSVNVQANDTVRVDLSMSETAVELTQVVVTGTGGAVEKRQVGASIGNVDAAKLSETMAIPDVGRMLAAKVAGLRSVAVGGGVGAGQDMRIRGIASFSLNQRPAIYIDGVRIDSRATEWANDGACCSFGGGSSTDRLGDLNPNDIERIEVLKGAAAATLYGSEATNGVIQIFTKRGRSSEQKTEWNLGLSTGYEELRHNLPVTLFPRFTGTDGTRALDANESLIEKGPYYGVDLSASGGTQRSTYFSSAQISKETGSIQPNDQLKGNLRLNLTFVPTDKWTVEARSTYARNKINELQAGNNWTALLGNAINGNPKSATKDRPYGEAWVPVKDIKTMTTQSDVDRWTGGLTATYSMSANFTHRLTVGLDAVNDHKIRFFPFEGAFGPPGVTDGQKNLGLRNYKTYTFDYLSTLKFNLPFQIESNLSVGGQGFWDIERLEFGVGNGFPGPGVNTISSAAVTSATETFTKTVNIGFLAQNRFAWHDQLFSTVGVRVDGNSAFGKNYGYKTYPKFDLSYDLMKANILPAWISAARIRGAWGQAGKMPGPFDAFTSYAATPVFASSSGIIPLNPGNADLRPEKSTETEVGFEAGLAGDRIGIEASYYTQKTNDAIIAKANAPSGGFRDERRVNIGEIENKGWEATVTYLAYSAPKLEWTTGVKLDGNKNKVTDLGGIVLGGTAVRLGYPIGAVWDRIPTGFSVVDGKPVTTRSDTSVYYGPGLPTFNGSLTNTVRWHSLSLYGLVSMERGAWFGNGDRAYRIRQGGADEWLKLLDASGNATFASDSLYQYAGILNFVDKRNNVRLRELSLSWVVPERYSRTVGAGATSIILTGQNLMWWDNCHCVDPNMNWGGSQSFTFNDGFLMQPAPRIFRVQLRTKF